VVGFDDLSIVPRLTTVEPERRANRRHLPRSNCSRANASGSGTANFRSSSLSASRAEPSY
jgi:hypothetical protein